MALGVPGFVRVGAVIAGCALVAACTPQPGPTTTPTAAPPATASPTPSATPTETEIERQQRLDFEAAEKAYRANLAEQAAPGQPRHREVDACTPANRRTVNTLNSRYAGLDEIRRSGWRARCCRSRWVSVTAAGRMGEYTFSVCEDGSEDQVCRQTGEDVTPTASKELCSRLHSLEGERIMEGSRAESSRVKSFRWGAMRG